MKMENSCVAPRVVTERPEKILRVTYVPSAVSRYRLMKKLLSRCAGKHTCRINRFWHSMKHVKSKGRNHLQTHVMLRLVHSGNWIRQEHRSVICMFFLMASVWGKPLIHSPVVVGWNVSRKGD